MNNKGFVTIYFLQLLVVVCLCVSAYSTSICNYLYYQQNRNAFLVMNNIEVLTVKRVIRDFTNFKEKNHFFLYAGAIVKVDIDGLMAYITIYYDGHVRERELKFDPVNEVANSYH